MYDETKREELVNNHKKLVEIDEKISNGICARDRLNRSYVFIFELIFAVPTIFLAIIKLFNKINDKIFVPVILIFLVMSIVIVPVISIAIYMNKTYHYFMKIDGRTFLLDFSSKTIRYYDGNLFLNIYKGKNNKVMFEKKAADYYEKFYFIFKYNAFIEGEFLSFSENRLIGHADFSKYRGKNREKYGEDCVQIVKLNDEGMPVFYRSKILVFGAKARWFIDSLTNKYVLLNEPNFKFPLPTVLNAAFKKYNLPIPENLFDLEHISHLELLNKINTTWHKLSLKQNKTNST